MFINKDINLGELHKMWTEAVQYIKSHHARMFPDPEATPPEPGTTPGNTVLSGQRRKITGLLLIGPKSFIHMKVAFVFHLEIKVQESEGRVERHRIKVL